MLGENEFNREVLLKLQREGRLPSETEAEGVPLITEATIHDLSDLFGIAHADVPAYFIPYHDDEDEYEEGFANGLSIASDVLSRYVNSDPSGYLDQLSKWMNSSFKDTYSSRRPLMKDSAIVGTAFVTKAFDLQFGPDMAEGLDYIAPERMRRAFGTFQPIEGKIALIDRLRKSRGRDIPLYQAFLTSSINNMAQQTPAQSAFRDGATLQYSILSLLWD